jgi:hypothetical protein
VCDELSPRRKAAPARDGCAEHARLVHRLVDADLRRRRSRW